ncbi:MAG TPA: PAS domain S-box protein, partial [Desulfobacteraceae bacterium]|nr:PAS domain S-box protein [Desulfobacteraceae bacterium]
MKLSIRWTIIIGSILLVWGTHLILTPSTYVMTKRVLTRHMHDIMLNISDLTMEQSYNHLDKARSAVSIDKQLLGSNVVSSEMVGTNSMERYFFDQLAIHQHLSGIYVGGPNGNFFMVSRHNKFTPDGYRTKIIRHDNGIRTVKLLWRNSDYTLYHYEEDPSDTYDPRARPWFKKVLEEKHVIWTDPYIFFTAQKPGVTIAGPAYDNDGNLKGIVGVDIEIAELSSFVSKLRVGKSGRAFILHRNGDVIAYPDPGRLIIPASAQEGLRLPKVEELGSILTQRAYESINWQRDKEGELILDEAEIASFKHGNKTYLSMFTPFPEPELPWIIGVYIPEDDYLAAIKSNQLVNIAATVIISVLASILGLMLARKITAPVVQLADGAKQIENHDIDTPFHVQTLFREIQETADSFSRMKVFLAEYKKKVHDNEEIYRAITNTANDAIVMINSSHTITFFNPAAEELFGYNSTEAVGKKLYELLAPQDDKQLHKKALSVFMGNGTGIFGDRTVKVSAMNKEGYEIPLEFSLSRLKLNDEWHAVAVIRNITERRKAAQLRKRLVNDLHDGVGGSLSNIKLLAEMSQSSQLPEQTARNLRAITELSGDCIAEIRNYMNILDDKDLSWKIFSAELHQYCARTLEPHNINYTM